MADITCGALILQSRDMMAGQCVKVHNDQVGAPSMRTEVYGNLLERPFWYWLLDNRLLRVAW